MDTKLTLKLNEDIIEKAKEYAKSKKILNMLILCRTNMKRIVKNIYLK